MGAREGTKTWSQKAALTIVLLFVLAPSVVAATHLFWYKARSNKYPIADCKPGPCLPQDAIIHEEKIVTGSWDSRYNSYLHGINIGAYDGDNELMSTFVWSEGLNAITGGKIISAKLRGEYVDNWGVRGKGGNIYIRCGVVDFMGNISAWGGIEAVPEGAVWKDNANPMNSAMGFNAQTKLMQAETNMIIQSPKPRNSPKSSPVLEGTFFEMDITNQVKWIQGRQSGQYAIMILVPPGRKTTGKFNAFGNELCDGYGAMRDVGNPWTKDGNSCHIIVKDTRKDPLVFGSKSTTGKIAIKDTVPPKATWIYPKPFSIIRSNSLKLIVDAKDNMQGSGVDKVSFFATLCNLENERIIGYHIGSVSKYPYEFTWALDSVPDQNIFQFSLNYDVVDKAGNHNLWREESGLPLVLDRNTDKKTKRFLSQHAGFSPIIDADLKDWATSDSIVFTNKDNRIIARSQWNRNRLYFSFFVHDKHVLSKFTPDVKDVAGLSAHDEIELFFDPDHNHNEIPDNADRQILIAAAGKSYAVKREENRKSFILDLDMQCSTRILGTNNDPTDVDTGFIIECDIGWKEIGIKPRSGKVIGFDMLNSDIDYADNKISYASWSGAGASNLHNPSEWGNLVFEGRFQSRRLVMLIGGILAAIILILFRYKKKVTSASVEKYKAGQIEKEEITRAKEYIAQYFSDSTLSREKVAGHVGLSPGYFSTFFKKEVGQSFIDYLANYRLERAKEILKNSKIRVIDIAMDIGFASVETFTKAFKRAEKVTPSEYRAKNQITSDPDSVK